VKSSREKKAFSPMTKGMACFSSLVASQVVAVAVELEPEGTPGGDAETAEAKLLVGEGEVVAEALAGIILEEGVSRRLVVPWLIARAG
jgi:hypothetical protein